MPGDQPGDTADAGGGGVSVPRSPAAAYTRRGIGMTRTIPRRREAMKGRRYGRCERSTRLSGRAAASRSSSPAVVVARASATRRPRRQEVARLRSRSGSVTGRSPSSACTMHFAQGRSPPTTRPTPRHHRWPSRHAADAVDCPPRRKSIIASLRSRWRAGRSQEGLCRGGGTEIRVRPAGLVSVSADVARARRDGKNVDLRRVSPRRQRAGSQTPYVVHKSTQGLLVSTTTRLLAGAGQTR